MVVCKGQQRSDSTIEYAKNSVEFLSAIKNKFKKFNDKVARRTFKSFQKFQKVEMNFYKKLKKTDSALAKELMIESEGKYSDFKSDLGKTDQKNLDYNAYIDTTGSQVDFINKQNASLLNDKKNVAKKYIDDAKNNLISAEKMKKFLSERKQKLKNEFMNSGMAKDFKKLEKNVYYYGQYINEYKNVLKDKKKIEKKLMGLLANNKAFKDFLVKNSALAGLFHMPGENAGDIISGSTAGIQTRENVMDLIQGRVAYGGPSAMANVKQQIAGANSYLSAVKDKINKYGGSADADVPSFKPNNQKVKSFMKRLEYGTDIQFAKAKFGYPSSMNLGFNIGYKLNDKKSVGIGFSYLAGMGSGWSKIRVTNEGIGFRSFIDWQFKKQISLAGGIEENLLKRFANFSQIRNSSEWQTSALLGLSKKVKMKGGKSSKVQLMYDFFSFNKTPQRQPLIFRSGISF